MCMYLVGSGAMCMYMYLVGSGGGVHGGGWDRSPELEGMPNEKNPLHVGQEPSPYRHIQQDSMYWENPRQLDTGQLDTGQLNTGQLDTRTIRHLEIGRHGQLGTLSF